MCAVWLHPSGYLHVGLSIAVWTRQNFKVHSLVLEAFIGPRPPGMQCRHLNGDRTDNRLENLRWGTAQENAEDKVRHGTARGNGLPPKLTSEQEAEIRAAYPAESLRSLGRRFGVSHEWIRLVVHRG